MKILVVCQYYKPEPFRISDVCEELVRKGHQVTVVTGTPNYPEGNIYPGYEGESFASRSDEVINGVKVRRCKIIPRKTGALPRFLNYYSYAFASLSYVRQLEADHDVVFVHQLSPVMMAYAGIAYKQKYNKKLVLYCLDLWPESLCTGGIKKGSLVYKVFHHISKRIYQQADAILVTSPSFTNYFCEEFKIDRRKISDLPQYAEDIFSNDNIETGGNHSERINLLFAGNIGVAQNVTSILQAAARLQDQDVCFHIVGSGTNLDCCKQFVQEHKMDNVVFYGRKPLESMPEFYQMADGMLISLIADPIMSMTLPGKVQSYMLAGKPIIGCIDGATRDVIQAAQCGFCSGADDIDALTENIIAFINLSNDDRRQLGNNARKYYQSNFSKEIYMNKLEAVLCRNGANDESSTN